MMSYKDLLLHSNTTLTAVNFYQLKPLIQTHKQQQYYVALSNKW